VTDQLLTAVLEIKELLKLIAEPQLAQRDENMRSALREIAGKSTWKQKIVPLLDGTRTQSQLRQEVKVDAGDLSRFIKGLREAKLLDEGEKPHLILDLPKNFFMSQEGK
jgi:hypothetical protein